MSPGRDGAPPEATATFWRLLEACEVLTRAQSDAIAGEDFVRLEDLTGRKTDVFADCVRLGAGALGLTRANHPVLAARLAALAAVEEENLRALRGARERVARRLHALAAEAQRLRQVRRNYAQLGGTLVSSVDDRADHGCAAPVFRACG